MGKFESNFPELSAQIVDTRPLRDESCPNLGRSSNHSPVFHPLSFSSPFTE